VKILISGYGSIGKRHVSNIRALYPDAHIIIADPLVTLPHEAALFYTHFSEALNHHSDAQAAIIASPHDCHLDQLMACVGAGVPAYVEKPLFTSTQLERARALLQMIPGYRGAVGFQYRYHRDMWKVRSIHIAGENLKFYGQDGLVSRYGKTVMDTMVSHPIDTALRLNGPALDVKFKSDGVQAKGRITHRNGGESDFSYRMDSLPRESKIKVGEDVIDLPPDNNSYAQAMAAFLKYAHGGPHDGRLATLADGLAVSEIMAQAEEMK